MRYDFLFVCFDAMNCISLEKFGPIHFLDLLKNELRLIKTVKVMRYFQF